MNFRRHEIDCIHSAKDMLVSDIKKHLTIGEISLKVGLNETKLKIGFKKVFGVGIYSYLLKARMEKAKELLSGTDKPLKEIAPVIGYRRTSSLIRSFKKMYNQSPASWRRKRLKYIKL